MKKTAARAAVVIVASVTFVAGAVGAAAQEPAPGGPGSPPSTTTSTTLAPPPPAPPADPKPGPQPSVGTPPPMPDPPAPKPQPPISAKPLDATILSVDPVDDGVFQVARIAPFTQGGAQRWRVRAHFVVKNTGKTTIKLVKKRLGYPGSQLGGLTELFNDTDPKPDVDSRAVLPGKTKTFFLDDGMARSPKVSGGNRSLFYPVAPNIRISLYFAGHPNSPLVYQAPQTVYVNKTPEGSYRFPGEQADLLPGEFWSTEIHSLSREQKFGYDFGVSRWDGKKWNRLREGAKEPFENEDFLIYGKPVYAMADGTVIRCVRSAPDNVPPNEGETQNEFFIDHGNGEIALYAHLQAGSVNEEFCPEDAPEKKFGLNIPVKAGDELGNVGNSGYSKAPHLHVHVQRGLNGTVTKYTGRPLLFRDSSNAGGFGSKDIGAGPFSLNPLTGQMPGAPFNLIDP